jgi:cytochrome c oxidase subunit II
MFSSFPFAPPQASNFASEYDTLFTLILLLSVFFAGVSFFFVIYFAIKYREGSKADRSSPMYENMRMEIAWIAFPTVIGLFIFAWGAKLFADMRTPPQNATEIYVIGKQWMWHVQHPNGTRENNTLHVPVGKPVKLTMIAQDVIHAFYIPAFRVQYMVVPGRYTQMWFTPTQKGKYHLFCNMYCGTQHSEMGGSVIAMDPRDYANWLAANGSPTQNLSAEQTGEKIFNKLGCNNCHGAQDMIPRGPTLVGLFGKTREANDGRKWVADESYIRESILRPGEKLTKGYAETMQSYQSQLSEEEVLNLVAYIKGGGRQSATNPSYAANSPETQAQVNGKAGLNSNALEYTAPRADSTPTKRGNNPAVGAIAAEKVDKS